MSDKQIIFNISAKTAAWTNQSWNVCYAIGGNAGNC